MATGNLRNAITDNQPLGGAEYQRFVDSPAVELADAVLALVKGDTTSGLILGPAVTLSYDAGDNTLSVESPTHRPAAGWWQGEVGQWDAGDDGFTDIPFEDDGSSVYYVGVRHNDVPASATLRRAVGIGYTFSAYRQALGFRATIGSVTDHGTGLRFVVTSADLGPAFANSSDARPVTVWKVTPVTASAEVVAAGTVVWTGSAFRVDLAHYLGQTAGAFSSTTSDYVVHVHGVSVNKATNLATVLEGGTQAYLMLGSFDSATQAFNYAAQARVAALEDSSAGGVAFSGLRKALRAGCYIGDYEATRDWNASANVTVNTGVDPVTFTFADPLTGVDGAYFFTGDQASGREPEISQAFASGGLVASLAKSMASGVYHIVAEVDRDGEIAVRVVSDATWTSGAAELARKVLHVWQFNFTTSTGAVASIVSEDLAARRGIASGALIGSSVDASGSAVFADEIVGGNEVKTLVRTGSGFAVSLGASVRRDLDGGSLNTRLALGSPAKTDLSSDQAAYLELGGSNDYDLAARNVGGTRDLYGSYGSDVWLNHLRTGGNATGTTGRVKVEDLHFATYKDVWEILDIGAAAQDGDWTRDIDVSTPALYSMGWRTTTDAAEIHFPIPTCVAPGSGAATEIVAVRVFHGGQSGGGTPIITSTVYSYTPDDTGGSAAAISGATASREADSRGWDTLTPTAPFTPAVGTRYFVRVTVDINGGGTSWISGLEVLRRHRQFV
ncbi:MAG: hypothetical protein AB7U23_13275 [Dehalococcoidia bacterium]